jgi:hypothetical protein
MTTFVPRLDVNADNAPDELMLASIRDREIPTWLVQRLVTHVTTQCGICRELIGSRDRAYYEQGEDHPAHVDCWLLQLTARPVRVVSIKYRDGGSAKCVPMQ